VVTEQREQQTNDDIRDVVVLQVDGEGVGARLTRPAAEVDRLLELR